MDRIENRIFDELRIGDAATIARTLAAEEVAALAALSRRMNPAHIDQELSESDLFRELVAHGLWSGAVVASLLGGELPGPGTGFVGQALRFPRPIGVGDTLTLTLRVAQKNADDRRVTFDCVATNQRGETVIEGTADVIAPVQKISRAHLGRLEAESRQQGHHYLQLVQQTKGLAPIRTAVVHPADTVSLLGAIEAAKAKLIVPVLVGPEAKIRAAADQAQIDLAPYELVPTEHSHAAAAQAAALARDRKVEALMKGSLHTDEFMGAIVAEEKLRTGRRMSHVFVIDAPAYPRPLFVTDAAINIYPTLEEKRDIIENAIELAHALGIAEPRVAILSAVETVTEKIKSTLDAAALCKMADRRQITGAILDGPLAFDNAVSEEAAKTKGIVSPVAGRADIFVVPDIEAGNMLAKQLEYLAEAQIAGIVLGARVPVILTSRADKTLARLGSCAIALLLARHKTGAAP